MSEENSRLQNTTPSQEIKKLQNNLLVMRSIMGMTTEEFGKKIGVTKQTISNLENQKTIMSLTQYIAIRTIIDYHIEHTGNQKLRLASDILLDDSDAYSEEFKKNFKNSVSLYNILKPDYKKNITVDQTGILQINPKSSSKKHAEEIPCPSKESSLGGQKANILNAISSTAGVAFQNASTLGITGHIIKDTAQKSISSQNADALMKNNNQNAHIASWLKKIIN